MNIKCEKVRKYTIELMYFHPQSFKRWVVVDLHDFFFFRTKQYEKKLLT